MRISLIGYGKMGRTIEALAIERGHEITAIIDGPDWKPEDLKDAEVAIEFTEPEAAVDNIKKCFDAAVPVVVGTTGWYNSYNELKEYAVKHEKSMFTATNFSIGVNILFHINKKLAKIMNAFDEYDVRMEETHHIHKKDYPSGTACTLAEQIIALLDRKKEYIGHQGDAIQGQSSFDLHINCKREDDVPGYHEVTYESAIDEIKISHTAKNRLGFAQGSLIAAEWMIGKTGVFGMNELLNFES